MAKCFKDIFQFSLYLSLFAFQVLGVHRGEKSFARPYFSKSVIHDSPNPESVLVTRCRYLAANSAFPKSP
jgi:hypothetical protein